MAWKCQTKKQGKPFTEVVRLPPRQSITWLQSAPRMQALRTLARTTCGARLSLTCWTQARTLQPFPRWQDTRTSKRRQDITDDLRKHNGKPPSYCMSRIKARRRITMHKYRYRTIPKLD